MNNIALLFFMNLYAFFFFLQHWLFFVNFFKLKNDTKIVIINFYKLKLKVKENNYEIDMTKNKDEKKIYILKKIMRTKQAFPCLIKYL